MSRVAALRAERRRIAMFLAAGVINTAFGFAAYSAAIAVGFVPAVAVVLSTAAGIMFNFRTLGAVFAAKGLSRAPHFVATHALLALVNMGLLHLAIRAGLGPYLGEVAVLCVVTPLSYLAMRFLVFPENKAGEAC